MSSARDTGHVPVTILAFDGSLEMSIVMARDAWHAGAVARHNANPDAVREPAGQVAVVSQDGTPVRTFNGSQFHPDRAMHTIERTDLVVVSGIWGRVEELLANNRPAIEWLAQQCAQGALVSCLHTGTFILAETGLLDGQVATVYWRMIDDFKRRYPHVILQPEKTITSAGRLYCASGIASGLELGTYLMEQLWGVDVAARVARHFLMDIPDSPVEFQLALERQKKHKDARIRAAQQWMEANFSSDFLLDEVADKVGLSLRSFRRRFKEATGEPPMQYLQRVRLETAKHLLTTSTLSIDQVSYRVGIEDASYFSRLFRQKLSMSPSQYRSQHRSQHL